MNIERAFEIMNNKKIYNVYFENHPVWIQEIKNNTAKVGYRDVDIEKNVNIDSLNETL